MRAAGSAEGRGAGLPANLLSRWQDRYRSGNLHDCESLARKLTRDFPDAGKAWQLLGASLLALNRSSEALPALRTASKLAPQDWSICDNLGIALQRQCDFDGAAEAFRSGMAHAPTEARLWSNASANALESGNPDEALRLAREAARLAPKLAAAHLNAGNALSASGHAAEAEAALLRALSIQPNYPQALLSLGRALSQRGQFAQAIEATQRALAITPDYAEAHVNIANYFNALGDIASAVAHYQRALASKPKMISAGSGALFCMLHDDRQSPEQIATAHAKFGSRIEAPHKADWKRHANVPDPERRLRLGFVSGDLRDHPVARFLEPVWRELDRQQFELFAYDTQPARDDTALRLRELADHWTIAATMPDAGLDARIRRDDIDILFDLSGHTARNRMGVFARKAAPVQVSWIGYPATTGLHAIDYRLTDEMATPAGRLDHLFTERLAYLPFMSVFDRPANLRAVAPSPHLAHGRLTFGSFNRMNKLNERSIALWAKVLARVPDSRFLIGALPDENMADTLRRRLVAAGIDESRLLFHQRLSLPEYLDLHAHVDVLLDALPFSSGTTANFALWMGVPTLTLAGNSMTERLGAARMHAAGLDAFIAESEDAFVDLAALWSHQRDDLARLRGELRDRMEQRAGAQSALLTRALERRLRQMWRRWCDGLPAERLL